VRLPESIEGPFFDLPNPLTREVQRFANLAQAPSPAVADSKSQSNYFLFAIAEVRQQAVHMRSEDVAIHLVRQRFFPRVSENASQFAAAIAPMPLLERGASDLDAKQRLDIVRAQPRERRGIFDARAESTLNNCPSHRLLDMTQTVGRGCGDVEGVAIVADGPAHGLADPPTGVGCKLGSTRVIVLLDGPHQTEAPVLDQVKQTILIPAAPFGDRDHQAQIGHDQLLARSVISMLERRCRGKVTLECPRRRAGLPG
jgi:hypothetical protein